MIGFHRSVLMIGLTAAFALMACSSTPLAQAPSQRLEAVLGHNMVTVLKTGTVTAAFRMTGGKTGLLKLADYAVDHRLPTPTAAQSKALTKLALQDTSYNWETRQRCAFLPNVGVRVSSSSANMVILFSQYCHAWAFSDGTVETVEDYQPVAPEVDALVTALLTAGQESQP